MAVMASYGTPTTTNYTWAQLYPLIAEGKLTQEDALAVVNGTANPTQQAKVDALVVSDPLVGSDAKAVHAKRTEDNTGQNPGPGSGSSGGSGGVGSNPGTPGDAGVDPNTSGTGGQGGGGGAPPIVPPVGSTPVTAGYFDSAGNWVTGAAGGTSATDAILRYLAPTAGNIVSSLIGANASSNATAAQQKYLQEALDYEKSRDSAAIALEGSRYSDYSGNIAPYLATGASANARMASLLGLSGGGAAPTPGGGPVQPDLPGGITTRPSATSTDAGATIGAPTGPVTTGPTQPRAAAMVTMRAPDGSVNTVSPADVQHYLSLGATLVGGAA